MTHFHHHFREHAVPWLRWVISGQALAVAAGSIEFQEAVSAVWIAARSKGAMFLPDAVLDDDGETQRPFEQLRDWILTHLSGEIDAFIAAEDAASGDEGGA